VAAAAAAATVATVLVAAPAVADDDGPVDAGITVHKIDGLPADFINGVDISTVLSEEESGVVYRDFAGNPADIFDVLADAGINYVRVRVWNNPYNAGGDGYGAGNVDVARATEIGERATAAGMKVLVDFHYSDFWADPGKQNAPKAWAGYDLAQTTTAVHDFTEDALQQMEDAGVNVGMVQVGNETNGAMAGVTGIDNLTGLFSAGSEAVRDVYPDALVAVHFTNPETSGRYASYAASLDAAHVDYDVFASSYYPYWHGTTTNLTNVLSDIATTYGKKVMVAETSWAYTNADGDGTTNTITSSSDTSMYPVSVQGQATEIRDVMAAVNAVPGGAGLGVFYWEPAWIPVPGTAEQKEAKWAEFGSGWATSAAHEYDAGAPTSGAEGSGWDNQALFDYTGKPLESLLAFTYARTGAQAPLAVETVESPTVTLNEGDAVTLPSTVQVTYNDSSTANVAVTWDDVLSFITSPGTYTVHGVTVDGDKTTAKVIVKAHNYLVNGDFETGDNSGWSFSASPWPSTFWIFDSPGNNAQGTYAVNAYDAAAFSFHFQQTVTGLEPGTYIATGQAHGQNVTPEFFVTTSDGTQTQTPTLTGWQAWKKPTITVTVPADGAVTVGVNGTGAAAGWAWFDEFTLVKAPASAADTSDLEELVDQMNGLVRSVYSSESLAVLDSALEIANIVLAASNPTEGQVDAATTAVSDAFDALVVVGDVPDPTVNAVAITVTDGNPILLPETVTVTAFDGRTHSESVTWTEPLSYIDGTGTYTIHGTSENGYPAVATVTVTQRNWVVNGSFEDDDTSMWTVDGAGAAIGWSGDSSDGDKSVAFWLGSDYTFSVSQQVTGLPAGRYVLSATAQGDGESGSDTHEVTLWNGETGQSAVLGLDGWQAFATATTEPVEAAPDGTLTVGAEFTLTSGAWGTVDDFRLVKAENNADLTDLNAAVAEANAIDRSLYEPASLVDLDNALGAYALVTQADDPSQATVDAVTHWIRDALSALDLIDVPFTTAPTPTITGTAKYGATLTANAGTWVPTPSGIAYQWKRNGAAIAGANGTTYSPVYGDIGAKITVTVTATKADYITASKTSGSVTIGKGVFTTQPTPKISGTPVAGKKLTVVTGTWSPKASAYQFQWYRDGKAISGQKGKTYTVKSADTGHKITVKVTALKTGFTSASKTSASVTVVKRFWSTGYATISGVAKSGSTLTAHRGLWNPSPTSYSYQWYRNGVAIPGATHATYKLTSADKGKNVAVKVTAKKSGYLPTSDMSPAKKVAAK
jgi:arabinogalactan endo-1,4-beta-galactosidase